jgi:hypothetical protein
MIYLANVSGGLASFWALKRWLDLNGTANTQAYLYVDKSHFAAFLDTIGIAIPWLYTLSFEQNTCSALCEKMQAALGQEEGG